MRERIRLHRLTFDEQCNYAVFHSFLELRNQEIKNLQWLCNLVNTQVPRNNNAWKKIIQTAGDEE